MIRPIYLPAILLMLSGCGGSSPQPPAKTTATQEEPSAQSAPKSAAGGTARQDQKELKAAWSIAFWDEDKHSLKIGFLEGTPSAEEIARIINQREMTNGPLFGRPWTQMTLQFKDGGLRTSEQVSSYVMLFFEFGDSPMSLNKGAPFEDALEWTGEIKPGSTIQGRFKGKDTWSFGDTKHEYSWDLTFNVTVR